MTKNLLLGLAALAASSTLIAPTVAKAADLDREQFSAAVPYGDLDLSTQAGQARLHARVAATVKRLCSDDRRDLNSRMLAAQCVEQIGRKAKGEVRLAIAEGRKGTRRA